MFNISRTTNDDCFVRRSFKAIPYCLFATVKKKPLPLFVFIVSKNKVTGMVKTLELYSNYMRIVNNIYISRAS